MPANALFILVWEKAIISREQVSNKSHSHQRLNIVFGIFLSLGIVIGRKNTKVKAIRKVAITSGGSANNPFFIKITMSPK